MVNLDLIDGVSRFMSGDFDGASHAFCRGGIHPVVAHDFVVSRLAYLGLQGDTPFMRNNKKLTISPFWPDQFSGRRF